MAEVKLENLRKTFGKTVGVHESNIDVKHGEFIVLLGPSGCGKTTTLRMIAGLETPSSGEIYFDGQPVSRVPSRDRNVAMAFERYALYPHLKVYKNISKPLEIRKMQKDEIDKRVNFYADLLELSDRLDHYPSQLSGGQRQRVGIARALVREPKVFLLDEPISHLDAKLRIRMRVELRKLIKEMDITCFYVTHDQVEGMTMGDRIVLMNKGKIMQIGTPDELFNQPDNLFTAYFVGEPTVSIIPCLLSEDNGEICLDIDGEKHQLDSLLRNKIKTANPGRELYLAFRPQFCSLKNQNSVTEDQNLLFKSVVSMIEPLGVDKIVHLTKGDHQLRCVCSVDTPINTGDHCLLQCNPEKIFLFDRKTEKSVIV